MCFWYIIVLWGSGFSLPVSPCVFFIFLIHLRRLLYSSWIVILSCPLTFIIFTWKPHFPVNGIEELRYSTYLGNCPHTGKDKQQAAVERSCARSVKRKSLVRALWWFVPQEGAEVAIPIRSRVRERPYSWVRHRAIDAGAMRGLQPVSYTHLTLPTKLSV